MYFYEKLANRQKLAVNTLSLGGTIKQASESASVSRVCVEKWLQHPEFVSAVDQKTNEYCDQVYRKIIAASSLATKTLVDVISDPESKTRDKITASSKILDLAMKRQDYLLMKKIELLEGMYGELEGELDFEMPEEDNESL